MKIVFLGAGSMAQALAQGIFKSEKYRGAQITAHAPSTKHKIWWQEQGFAFARGFEVPTQADIYIVAVKPKGVKDVVEALGSAAGQEQIVVSVAAGVSVQSIRDSLPSGSPPAVVRAMPNLAAQIGQSATGIFAPEETDAAAISTIFELFAAVGETIHLAGEDQLHAFTALAGSGPGFIYDFAGALAAAAQEQGFSPEACITIAKQTLAGAANLAIHDLADFTQLADRITSPQGTTQAGREVLHRHNLHRLVSKTVHAATQCSKELAQDNP